MLDMNNKKIFLVASLDWLKLQLRFPPHKLNFEKKKFISPINWELSLLIKPLS